MPSAPTTEIKGDPSTTPDIISTTSLAPQTTKPTFASTTKSQTTQEVADTATAKPSQSAKSVLGHEDSRVSVTSSLSTTTEEVRVPVPDSVICNSAFNMTEAIRKQHQKPNTSPGQAQLCDPKTLSEVDSEWFRFIGEAGSRLLNECPVANSCGTQIPIWSNADMPTAIQVPTTIEAYGSTWSPGSFENFCQAMKLKLEVMRCSYEPNDYVYKFDGRVLCAMAFCSME